MRWPGGCVLLIVAGVALLAFPQRLEGPPLAQVGVGHAVSAVDLLGILPLAAGSLWLHIGLWRRRTGLGQWVREAPGSGIATFFVCGLGLGLLIASAFSSFFWWWAIGAVLFLAMHIPLLVAARRDRG